MLSLGTGAKDPFLVKRKTHGETRLGLQTFSFVLPVRGRPSGPHSPAPHRPCLLTRGLGWKHLVWSKLRVWIHGSFQNQTKSLQCGGLASQLAAVRVIRMIFLGSFSPSLPSACPAGEPPSQPTWCTEGLRNSTCLQLTPDTAHPSLGALGKSPTLDVRPLCPEGSLFSSQRE